MSEAISRVVAFALPPRCAGCGQIVVDDLQLCVTCWESMTFLTGSGCERCGIPIAPIHAVCARCLKEPPDHDGAFAAVAYGDIARKIILKLKHGRHIGMAGLVGQLMVRLVPDEPAILIPVPLHRWRILRRGFNQSALIARCVAKATGLPLHLDGLCRSRSTPLLRGANARERGDTVRGAFSVAPTARAKIQGRTIFLVDDVYTSGATANACARELKRAGAAKVLVFCWARVLLTEGAD
jgi:ComF family protein